MARTETGGASATGDGYRLTIDPAEPVSGERTSSSAAELTVARGQAARVSVSGFQPASTVQVWLFSEPNLLGEFETDGDGVLEAVTDRLGDEVSACRHTLHAVGTTAAGDDVEVSLGVWVEADPYPFTDVLHGAIHRPAIGCLEDRGIVRGMDADTFAAQQSLTRGQAATMLANQLGLQATGPAPFADVVGITHEAGIAALAAAGIIDGVDADTFAPHQRVSRGQLATMLAAGYGLALNDTLEGTHDAAVTELVDRRILRGLDDGELGVDLDTTRGQAASLLVRAMVLER